MADLAGLRPTPDRIRETLFNWLAPYLEGARCLDLYAGSGALGLEAASRGARSVDLVERDTGACHVLQANIQSLSAAQVRVHRSDVLSWLRGSAKAYDIVFADPPYASGELAEILARLSAGGWLQTGAWVYAERPSAERLEELPDEWRVHRHKKAGQVGYHLLQYQPGAPA